MTAEFITLPLAGDVIWIWSSPTTVRLQLLPLAAATPIPQYTDGEPVGVKLGALSATVAVPPGVMLALMVVLELRAPIEYVCPDG